MAGIDFFRYAYHHGVNVKCFCYTEEKKNLPSCDWLHCLHNCNQAELQTQNIWALGIPLRDFATLFFTPKKPEKNVELLFHCFYLDLKDAPPNLHNPDLFPCSSIFAESCLLSTHRPVSVNWERVTQTDAVAAGYTLQPCSREALVQSERETE